MSVLNDAVQVLGEERVAEIRAGVDDLLRLVLANRERYARKQSMGDLDGRKKAA